jgi:glycosyltransferase involved in cell wall biosynthesis
MKNTPYSLDIVVPVFNEAGSITQFHQTLCDQLAGLEHHCRVIYVNDGSDDGTAELLDGLHAGFCIGLTVVHLSRNFGHQAALTAGLDESSGDAVVTMDGDLQHPPVLLTTLVQKWLNGFDIVQTIRRKTADASHLKRLTSMIFYKILNFFSQTQLESGAADFRLMSRRVVDVFCKDLRERDRFLRGMVSWVGFKTEWVEFDAPARFAGKSKYSLRKMLNLARAGVISFSRIPLKIATWLGLLVSILSICYGLFAIAAHFIMPDRVNPGWASLIVAITFLSGCQMVFLGLVGEYLAVVFDEVKQRPVYIVAKKHTNPTT